jgi:hypothetical protein
LRKKGIYEEQSFKNQAEYEEFLEKKNKHIIPILLKNENNSVDLISGFSGQIEKESTLLFIKRESYNATNDDELIEEL